MAIKTGNQQVPQKKVTPKIGGGPAANKMAGASVIKAGKPTMAAKPTKYTKVK